MTDADKTREQLVQELEQLRAHVAQLEQTVATLSERNLNIAQLELDGIFRALPDLFFRTDLDGTIVDYRAGRDTDLYVPPEQFLGKRMQALLPPEVSRQFQLAFEELTQGKSQAIAQYALRLPGGEKTFEARLLPLGQDQRIIIVRDVTERQQAEAALRAAETKYRIVADNTYDWEFWIGPQGQFIYSSPSCERVTGRAASEFEANPDLLTQIIHPDDLALYTALARDSRQMPGHVTFRIVRPDGNECWVEHFCQPVFSSDGKFLGRRGSNRDVTERKQAEKTLRQANLELQARNEELDAFAHTVAHDLNNPASVIIGYAETILENYAFISDDERQELVQIIARSGRKMSDIIAGLLLLAEVRKGQVEREPLDMAGIVAEALERLSDMVKECRAEVVLPPAFAWPSALGYSPWVEEVWTNYISNACKYGGHPPRIELGATVQMADRVRFWVKDNGAGLAPEEQARLFTPFTRLDQLRARGHGLGLSIVQRIVEKLDGQVSVESAGAPGEGCTFSFTLPAA